MNRYADICYGLGLPCFADEHPGIASKLDDLLAQFNSLQPTNPEYHLHLEILNRKVGAAMRVSMSWLRSASKINDSHSCLPETPIEEPPEPRSFAMQLYNIRVTAEAADQTTSTVASESATPSATRTRQSDFLAKSAGRFPDDQIADAVAREQANFGAIGALSAEISAQNNDHPSRSVASPTFKGQALVTAKGPVQQEANDASDWYSNIADVNRSGGFYEIVGDDLQELQNTHNPSDIDFMQVSSISFEQIMFSS